MCMSGSIGVRWAASKPEREILLFIGTPLVTLRLHAGSNTPAGELKSGACVNACVCGLWACSCCATLFGQEHWLRGRFGGSSNSSCHPEWWMIIPILTRITITITITITYTENTTLGMPTRTKTCKRSGRPVSQYITVTTTSLAWERATRKATGAQMHARVRALKCIQDTHSHACHRSIFTQPPTNTSHAPADLRKAEDRGMRKCMIPCAPTARDVCPWAGVRDLIWRPPLERQSKSRRARAQREHARRGRLYSSTSDLTRAWILIDIR